MSVLSESLSEIFWSVITQQFTTFFVRTLTIFGHPVYELQICLLCPVKWKHT